MNAPLRAPLGGGKQLTCFCSLSAGKKATSGEQCGERPSWAIPVVLGAVALSWATLSVPLLALAQEPKLGYPLAVGSSLLEIINLLLVTVALLALLLFFWGLALFILRAGEAEERVRGRQRMLWGVIALFVLVSVWGFVAILRQLFGTKSSANLSPPHFSDMPGVEGGGASFTGGGGGGGAKDSAGASSGAEGGNAGQNSTAGTGSGASSEAQSGVTFPKTDGAGSGGMESRGSASPTQGGTGSFDDAPPVDALPSTDSIGKEKMGGMEI